jgi:hypothetical protein
MNMSNSSENELETIRNDSITSEQFDAILLYIRKKLPDFANAENPKFMQSSCIDHRLTPIIVENGLLEAVFASVIFFISDAKNSFQTAYATEKNPG